MKTNYVFPELKLKHGFTTLLYTRKKNYFAWEKSGLKQFRANKIFSYIGYNATYHIIFETINKVFVS